MSFERILVPVDFSDLSKQALTQAASLAKQLDAELTLLHVHEHLGIPSVDPAFQPAQDEAAETKLIDTLTRQLRELLVSVNHELEPERIHVAVRVGSPVNEIIEVSALHDLVAMATHGRTGVGQFLLGSVTERVVRGANCSTLVLRVPGDARESD